MSQEINVVAKTQIIVVESPSSSISVINAGPQGPAGPSGSGVPSGGTTGQVLAKLSNTNGHVGWIDLP